MAYLQPLARLRAHFRRAPCMHPTRFQILLFLSGVSPNFWATPLPPPPKTSILKSSHHHSDNQPYIFNLSRSTTQYHFVISERFLLLSPPFSSLYSLNNQFPRPVPPTLRSFHFHGRPLAPGQATSHSTLPTHHFFTRLSVTYLVCGLKSITPYTLDF